MEVVRRIFFLRKIAISLFVYVCVNPREARELFHGLFEYTETKLNTKKNVKKK